MTNKKYVYPLEEHGASLQQLMRCPPPDAAHHRAQLAARVAARRRLEDLQLARAQAQREGG